MVFIYSELFKYIEYEVTQTGVENMKRVG